MLAACTSSFSFCRASNYSAHALYRASAARSFSCANAIFASIDVTDFILGIIVLFGFIVVFLIGGRCGQ